MIDRYSSSTLDRPFAIADQDIAIALPANVDDADLAAASALYPDLSTFENRYSGSTPNEMTVFLACVRLRQITSRIQRLTSVTMNCSSRYAPSQAQILATGDVFCALDELLIALENWRTSTPTLTSPKCLYERREYFEFLHARERLLLIRRVMEAIPKRKGVPPQHLLALSLETATRGIELFSGLFEKNAITYTRSYFSFLFTAGLSIMLSVTISDGSTDGCGYMGSSSETLFKCEDTLRRLGEKLPDAKPYVTVFEELHRNVAKGFYKKSNSTRRTMTFIPIRTDYRAMGGGSVLEQQYSQAQAFPPFHSNQFERNRPQDLTLCVGRNTETTFSANMSGVNWPPLVGNNPESAGIYGADNHLEPSASFSAELSSPNEYTMFPWASLTEDNPLWSMEAGLGEYAYGDAGFNMALFQ